MNADLEVMKAVTEELVTRGYSATMEYPGYIAISRFELEFNFGTANGETWDGDIAGVYEGGIVATGVPADSMDVKAIADGIAQAVESCKPVPTDREKDAWNCFLYFTAGKYDERDIARLIQQVTGVEVSPESEDMFAQLSDKQVTAMAAHVRKLEGEGL